MLSAEIVPARFSEEQQFRQVWVWAIALVVVSTATAYAVAVLFEKFVVDGLAHKPAGVSVQMLVSLIATGMAWTLLYMLYQTKLLVLVTDTWLEIRFFPLARPYRVPISEIALVEPILYDPMRDLGGWGVRTDPGRRSYTVSGRKAVVLYLKSNEEILLGTERPEGLKIALTSG